MKLWINNPFLAGIKSAPWEKNKKAIVEAYDLPNIAKTVYKNLQLHGLDLKGVTIDQLAKGISAEYKEHGGGMGDDVDLLNGSIEDAARIAVAHLRENPKYYDDLEKMEAENESKFAPGVRVMDEFGDILHIDRIEGKNYWLTNKAGKKFTAPIGEIDYKYRYLGEGKGEPADKMYDWILKKYGITRKEAEKLPIEKQRELTMAYIGQGILGIRPRRKDKTDEGILAMGPSAGKFAKAVTNALNQINRDYGFDVEKVVDMLQGGTLTKLNIPMSAQEAIRIWSSDMQGADVRTKTAVLLLLKKLKEWRWLTEDFGTYGIGDDDPMDYERLDREAAEEMRMEIPKFRDDAWDLLRELIEDNPGRVNQRSSLESEINRILVRDNWSNPHIPKVVKGVLDQFYKAKKQYLAKWGVNEGVDFELRNAKAKIKVGTKIDDGSGDIATVSKIVGNDIYLKYDDMVVYKNNLNRIAQAIVEKDWFIIESLASTVRAAQEKTKRKVVTVKELAKVEGVPVKKMKDVIAKAKATNWRHGTYKFGEREGQEVIGLKRKAQIQPQEELPKDWDGPMGTGAEPMTPEVPKPRPASPSEAMFTPLDVNLVRKFGKNLNENVLNDIFGKVLRRYKDARGVAVENFLMSATGYTYSEAINNLRMDAKSYGWKSPTVNAITLGLQLMKQAGLFSFGF